MSAFVSVPSIQIERTAIEVTDRPDLGIVAVHLASRTSAHIQISDPATARALALAFAQAADMLTAQAAERQGGQEGGAP
jgi:hypothetical protein